MTLGPALIALAYFDRHPPQNTNPLVIFGRVPMFYFILHFYVIHTFAVLLAWLRYGTKAFSFMLNPVPSMGGPQKLFPPNFGYSLWVTYLVWIAVLVCLYPVCRWYANIKATHRNRWLSYL